jgi:glycosyltransferase involved in cell wall biosynthesis
MTRREFDSIHPRLDRGLSAPPRLVSVGRLSPEKGVRHLLDAIGRLKSVGASLPELRILGDGPERQSLEQQSRRLGIEQHVRFMGYLDRERLSTELHDADLCVHPALTESLSKAWLDAMAHGVPVLSSDVGVASSVIGRTGERGWLVPPGDDRALAEGIQSALARESGWPALRQRCRAFVEDHTLETWARQIGTICAEQWGGRLADGKLRA